MKEQISVRDFCLGYDACTLGRSWALKHCETMQDVWRTARPDWLVWVASCSGVLPLESVKRATLFFVRQVVERDVVLHTRALWDAIVQHDEGAITVSQLADVYDATLATALSLSWTYENRAVRDAARVYLGAKMVASAEMGTALRMVAWSGPTGRRRTRQSRRLKYVAKQAEWFRENTTPCFEANAYKGIYVG